MAPCVCLLSDFGLDDPYVAEMKASLLAEWLRFPDAGPLPPIIDLSHGVEPGDIAAGAWMLERSAWRHPPGTVFVGVVDPGVGSGRPALAVSARSRFFVGPGNGLFAFLARESDLQLTILDDPLYHRGGSDGPAATFHGRDIFAVAAAQLAAGVPPAQLGSPGSLVQLGEKPQAGESAEGAIGRIVWIDRFGNAITDIARRGEPGAGLDSGAAVGVGRDIARGPVATFAAGAAAELFWYWGSGDTLEVALRDGNAAELCGLARGMCVFRRPENDSGRSTD